ncbi:hypothetical protein PTTW11_10334 [Pyrenophora teres f. teres]|uniref:Uncharacterized protein n=1 Tax=Pyrenophora teres f. teres TaxID=97479 RepID=A0A6S6WJ87_9PLEO|nr:hypothetical protein PTNB29_09232 [Pyrenophora teres f. teres]CAE7212687.1 hypothetical protein PTTW11_10334 [Pyrenophora teres f. teres]
MKAIAYLVFLAASTVTTAAPLESSPFDEGISLSARSDLFARGKKLCLVNSGINCWYDYGGTTGWQCAYHKCNYCTCDGSMDGYPLVNRDCAQYCPNNR